MLPFAFSQEPKTPIETQLDEVRALSRSGNAAEADKASEILSNIPPDKLTDTQADTWVSLYRMNALQKGDLAKLRELATKETTFPSDKTYEVLFAYGKLTQAEVAESKKMLEKLNGDNLNPREERRVFALRAKIGRLEGDEEVELDYLERMLDHLPYWPTTDCQSCHNDLKNPDRMTTISIGELWFGNRYAEILKSRGDARKVRDQAQEALAKDTSDVGALIKLGFAMRALDDEKEAQSAFKKIPFAKESGNDLSNPRMLFAFP
jgi:tetratricopeptide (TPR) repeat protein